MDEGEWLRIQAIFARTADLPAEAQAVAVRELCTEEPGLEGPVLELLQEDRRENSLLDSGVDPIAQDLLALEAMPSLIQQQIGPYRFLRLLGEGGMGVVYLAERTDIGGLVAVKLLRDAWLSPMRRERFRMEQLTLAQLNHPAIARIYDSNALADGTPWFVMEYADGLPLTAYWAAHAGTIAECLKLFRQVCEAVQYAHSHAVIHRDLKPSNILVTGEGLVKLLDFGIAKQLDFEEGVEERTITGLRLMTPAYAAPEQQLGGAVGVYTDVYALGVMLYELLTGSLPVFSEGTGKAEKPSLRIVRANAERRGELSKTEWADLDCLVSKAMEVDPERRYQSAGALIRDADAFLEGRALDAQPDRLGYRVGKFVRRNRRVLAGLGAALLVVAGIAVFYTVRLAQARNAALQEAARTRRIQQFTESLFDGGDPAAGPSMDLKAAELLDRGRLQAASLGADPEMQADMQETLGGIYQKLGKLEQADPLLVSALAERQKLLGPKNRKVGLSMVALGLLRRDEGKLDEAEKLTREGVEMDRGILPEKDPELAAAMVALGSVLEVRGKYDEARQELESALKLQPQGAGATAATSENLTELANVHFYQSQYDAAESLDQQSLEIDRRLFGERHPAVAQVLNNLGAIQMNRGNYAASESYYRQSLAITEAWYGTDHPETAANLTALAQPITAEDRDAEAQELLERALEIQKRVNGPVSSTVATTTNQLGMLALKRGEHEAARGYFSQALEAWRKLFGDGHQFIAIGYSNLGSVCMDEKDYTCAEKMYREAVWRLDAVSKYSFNAAVAHLKLGRTLLREGRFADAQPHTYAAYTYLVKEVSPGNRYLTSSRKDLAAIYDGLHEPEQAARYRAELNAAAH